MLSPGEKRWGIFLTNSRKKRLRDSITQLRVFARQNTNFRITYVLLTQSSIDDWRFASRRRFLFWDSPLYSHMCNVRKKCGKTIARSRSRDGKLVSTTVNGEANRRLRNALGRIKRQKPNHVMKSFLLSFKSFNLSTVLFTIPVTDTPS